MQIMKLREEYRARMGAAFRLGEFHDRLLSYGMPPLKIIRLAMLGETGGASVGPNNPTEVTRAIDFSVLATGYNSGYQGGRGVQLITNQSDWANAWNLIGRGSSGPMPEVNFNTRAVIIAHQGLQRTGGYGISIAEIRRDGISLTVRVNEQSPKQGDVVTEAQTSPFVAVSIPRPPEGSIVKYDDEVKKLEQNRNVNERRYPVYRRYGRRRRG